MNRPTLTKSLAFGLLFELGHALQLAEGGGALEQPGESGVLGHVALREHGADLRLQSAREQPRGCIKGAPSQLRRVLLDGQRVQVDHAEDRVGLVLVGDPLTKGAEVVADVRRTGRLHS